MDKIEYRVRPVTRFVVTRYESLNGHGASEVKGLFDSDQLAFDSAYAQAFEERERLGYPPGDERVVFPERPQAAERRSE